MPRLLSVLAVLIIVSSARGQTTRPAAGGQSADDVLNRLLQPSRPAALPLEPLPDLPKRDVGTAKTVAPAGEQLNLIREGTYLVDRVGRLNRTAENMHELTLEADGKGMKDPPLLILPNLKLMTMEKYIQNTSRDLRFRVTGLVTEYNGRNYILLDKVVVVPDQLAPVPRKDDSDLRR